MASLNAIFKPWLMEQGLISYMLNASGLRLSLPSCGHMPWSVWKFVRMNWRLALIRRRQLNVSPNHLLKLIHPSGTVLAVHVISKLEFLDIAFPLSWGVKDRNMNRYTIVQEKTRHSLYRNKQIRADCKKWRIKLDILERDNTNIVIEKWSRIIGDK